MTIRGKVTRLLADKGFGFILGEDDKKDYFFHMSSCLNNDFDILQIGDEVDFIPTSGNKGLRAEQVRVANNE